MFSEKSRLVEKRENPFYGSYKENTILEEIHWQNRKKKRQLCMVVVVTLVLVALAIGITLAITLPPLLDERSSSVLDPEDPPSLLAPSPSILAQYEKAGVSSDSKACSDIGNEVLRNLNGSAVDAAVAMTLCVGVTNPQSSGLGGGFFMVIYNGTQMHALNARESAPLAVDPLVYDNDPISSLSGGLAVGIPGEVAGLWEAHQKFGKVAWKDLVRFAQDLALNGFSVSKQLAKSMLEHREKLLADPILRSEFIDPETNDPWLEGETIMRPRLAGTLESLGNEGISSFYSQNGTIASNIVREVEAANGIITLEDLTRYRAHWEEPVQYPVTGNLTMYSLPFPSSGSIVALALGILGGFGRKRHGDMTTADIGSDTHRLAETLKYATSYRAHVADPRFANTTQIENDLLSVEFATKLREQLEEFKTFHDPRQYGAQFSLSSHDAGTAHISIIGPNGDAVALTSSINLVFGAGFMGNSTGIIYNNQINDFTIGNGTDKFGLPVNPDNKIVAGKQPASSMAPLIFLNQRGEPVFVTGGSGGMRILPSVISTSWRALYRYMDIKQAIDYPRIAADFHNARLNYEYGLPMSIVEELKRRGHVTHRISNSVENFTEYIGSINSVCKTKQTGVILANSDYRRHGETAGF